MDFSNFSLTEGRRPLSWVGLTEVLRLISIRFHTALWKIVLCVCGWSAAPFFNLGLIPSRSKDFPVPKARCTDRMPRKAAVMENSLPSFCLRFCLFPLQPHPATQQLNKTDIVMKELLWWRACWKGEQLISWVKSLGTVCHVFTVHLVPLRRYLVNMCG